MVHALPPRRGTERLTTLRAIPIGICVAEAFGSESVSNRFGGASATSSGFEVRPLLMAFGTTDWSDTNSIMSRISTDPRIEKLFRDRLEKLRWIRRDIAPGDSVSDSEVDAIVEETVETIFNEVQDLVTIRYRELDRITRHGVLPLPVDGPFELQLLESPVDR